MRNGLQDSSYSYQSYSASSRYQQPTSSGATAGSFPFEADFQQSLGQGGGGGGGGVGANYDSFPQGATFATPQMPTYSTPTMEYRTISQSISPPLSAPVSSSVPSYVDQLQQMNESYQQEQLQAQMQAQQQQRQQERLLMDLYKQSPQGAGRAVTDNQGRGQAFYTADQYINFLNRQHQDVFSQQQNHPNAAGYQFSPLSAYTNGMPATTMGTQGMQYSPSTNVSQTNYTNGKLSYNY